MFNRKTVAGLAACILLLAPICVLAGGLQRRVEGVVRAAELRDTQVSLVAVDLSTGDELISIQPTASMVPASNLKLITTSAALHVLGPDYVFRTELRLVEPKDWAGMPAPVSADPTFDPNKGPVLVVHGDGDPALGDPNLLRQHNMDIEQLLGVWVDAVRNTGLKRIQRLIMDDRVFDRQLVHPTWPSDQLHLWYCAQVSGINIHNNSLGVYVEPTQLGESPMVTTSPIAGFLSPQNRAVTGKSDTFWISRKPQTNEITYWGQVKNRRSSPVRVTFHDPSVFLGRLLAMRLEKAGVVVESIHQPDMNDLLPQGRALHAIQTTLPVVLERCNKDSQNLFAEALLKRMGRRFTGSPGSWKSGPAAVRAFLSKMLGPRGSAVLVIDGSGLSAENRVTARTMVDLLARMQADPIRGPVLRQSLSIGGVDGTLRNRFKQGIAGRVYGKSGYINGVSCLSGYIVVPGQPGVGGIGFDGKGERVVAFSFLFNNIKPPIYVHQIKNLQNKLVKLIDQEMAARQEEEKARLGG